jgi:hypothetical protein
MKIQIVGGHHNTEYITNTRCCCFADISVRTYSPPRQRYKLTAHPDATCVALLIDDPGMASENGDETLPVIIKDPQVCGKCHRDHDKGALSFRQSHVLISSRTAYAEQAAAIASDADVSGSLKAEAYKQSVSD